MFNMLHLELGLTYIEYNLNHITMWLFVYINESNIMMFVIMQVKVEGEPKEPSHHNFVGLGNDMRH